MSDWIGFLTYCIIGGITFGFFNTHVCKNFDLKGEAIFVSIIAGLGWIITLPFIIGFAVFKYVLPNPTVKGESRRVKELAEAKHELEVAKIKRLAAEELDREYRIATR